MTPSRKEIRAVYTDKTIRVYQAYGDAIADSALASGRFVSPPFKMERMTWIKPSFLWMMYRSGWGRKDANQNRILAIDITRDGFEWALAHSLLSDEAKNYSDRDEWLKIKKSTPVRIQWDPDRDLHLQPMEYRAIQVGLSNEAVQLYIDEWIVSIEDISELAFNISHLVAREMLDEAKRLCPVESVYPLTTELIKRVQAGS